MTTVYIDGQNFLYKAAEVLIAHHVISDKQDLTSINLRGLLEQLFPHEPLDIRFYGVARIRRGTNLDDATQEKSRRFADNLRRLKNSLAKQNITFIASGILLARDSEPCPNCGFHKYHFLEKGVDVSLAVDLVNDAATGAVDKIVLLSSDMDILPAITLVQSLYSQPVTYVGVEHRMTYAIRTRTAASLALKEIDIINAFLEFF